MKNNPFIFFISFALILASCDKPKPNYKRTLAQKEALNNDTLLLNFSLFMDSINFKVNFLKEIGNKKIVKMTDGDYKYELDLSNKKYYGSIVPSFLKDSLVSLEIIFGNYIDDELKDILEKKYGEPSEVEKSSISWYSEDFRKTITLNTSESIVKYSNTNKESEYYVLKMKKQDVIKDSMIMKTKKDF